MKVNTFNLSARLLLLAISTLMACVGGEMASAADQPTPAPPPLRTRPLMRDFMGLNVHTVQFKPELYAPVCRRVRDYHPFRWDVGDDPSRPTAFPMTVNGVDWKALYGSWTKAGFDVDACIMFDDLLPAAWKDPAHDARAYGEAFARAFGPSSGDSLVSAVEIGNEPAKYTEVQYRAIFEAMAHGLRAGDVKLKIATCAVMTGKTDQWSKPLSSVAGLEDLYDVLNVHSYPFKELWPTWRRSFPEDPTIRYLKAIDDVIRYRDQHAPGKEVWLTEFGYDSSSKPPPTTGPWAKWVGVNDLQQAQYIARSFLILSSMDLDRAYLYYFNDQDEPQLHGASGITRDFKPKPSFYAMSHLYKTLGDYRFNRALSREEHGCYCFEYQHATKPNEHVYVIWSAGGEGKHDRRQVALGPNAAKVYRAERLATAKDQAEPVQWKISNDAVEVEVTETPLFLWAR